MSLYDIVCYIMEKDDIYIFIHCVSNDNCMILSEVMIIIFVCLYDIPH